MINFILGYILGLLTATFILVVLTYFRRVIEHRVNIIEKIIETTGPKPRGFIIEAEDENESIRREVIEKNARMGRDTRLEELQ